jgi:hypothetical protein
MNRLSLEVLACHEAQSRYTPPTDEALAGLGDGHSPQEIRRALLIQAALAGDVAEEIQFGEPSGGASSDQAQVDATILAQMRQVLRQGGRSDSEIGACIPKVPAIRQRHKQDTEQLLRQNWGAVEALAKELLQPVRQRIALDLQP